MAEAELQNRCSTTELTRHFNDLAILHSTNWHRIGTGRLGQDCSYQLRRQAINDHRTGSLDRNDTDRRAVLVDDWRPRHSAREVLRRFERQPPSAPRHAALKPAPPEREHACRAFAGRRVLNLILLGRTAALRSKERGDFR